MGNKLTNLYDRLNYLGSPVTFQLSPEQQPAFLSHFQDWKTELSEFISDDLDGSVNRLGLIFFRISMILATLRSYEEGGLLQEITCSDLDFSLTLSITETLEQVSLLLFYWFPETKQPPKKKNSRKKPNKLLVLPYFVPLE